MKTIKVIDLLNKIANGEEVPKKIKYDNVEFVYGAFTMEGDFLEGLDGKSYNGEKSGYWSKEQNGWFEFYIDFDSLNDEVEIIEENPTLNDIRESYGLPRIEEHKIPEKLNIPEMSCRKKWKRDIDVWEKINEILDYLEVNND